MFNNDHIFYVAETNPRDIASAIRDLLDAVNEVSKKHQANPKLKEYKKVLKYY